MREIRIKNCGQCPHSRSGEKFHSGWGDMYVCNLGGSFIGAKSRYDEQIPTWCTLSVAAGERGGAGYAHESQWDEEITQILLFFLITHRRATPLMIEKEFEDRYSRAEGGNLSPALFRKLGELVRLAADYLVSAGQLKWDGADLVCQVGLEKTEGFKLGELLSSL